MFKNKNSWQHKDSNVRIAAINEQLTLDNNDDKNILLSLLNKDKSELVRRAVLLKLSSFDDYFNTSNSNNNKAVQEFAAVQVHAILANKHEIRLTDAQKHVFLLTVLKSEPRDLPLLKYWLEHEIAPTLVISLFEALVQKRNTAQFLLQIFANKQIASVQKQLLSLELADLNDKNILIKLSKKAVDDEVMQLINDRLVQLIEQQEQPKRVLKQSQLLLSKLLALKDLIDYPQYLAKKASLVAEWQHNLPQTSCLSADDQQTLLDKYDKITAQLTQLFASKAESYQQANIAAQLVTDKESAKNDFNETMTAFNQEIITAVFEDETIEAQDFLSKLSLFSERLTASVLSNNEKTGFLSKVTQLEQRLTQLPEIAQSVSEATYLISHISQLALPQTLNELNDRQQTYYDWLDKWKVVDQKACGILPQSIKDAHKEITQLWRNGLKPWQLEQKQLFGQTKKKLNDLKRLLSSGKYKVCFGLFKGVNQVIVLLSPHQQQQLQRDFDNVSEKMAEVSDWEHYIATPRKQELLAKITSLVTLPLDNPNEQADQVKQYRKTWNSLGHAEEGLEKELNDQFNLACEQAFAPCRLFYAEQEKCRAQHLVTRNLILEHAAKLASSVKTTDVDSSPIDFKALDAQLNKLQQRWQQAGEVDRQQYQKLFKQFKNTIQPISKVINDFHQANNTAKQALIAKAEQQLTVEDVYHAIDSIKKLQQLWREIGFAGTHQESKLWQKFRTINDQVFAKREQAKSDQKTALDELTANFKQTLNDIKASIVDNNTSVEKNPLLNAKAQAEELLSQVLVNKPVLKSVASAIEAFIKQLTEQMVQIKVEQETKSWQCLFSLLDKMAQGEFNSSPENITSDDKYQSLTSFWQKRLVEQYSLSAHANNEIRADKTLAIEILAKVESPVELAQQRMAVQVSLMQEQMLSGTNIDLSQSLVEWLRLGKLNTDDLAQLERLKKVFLK
ncbi:MAG: DUF349 domain-containing protein [Colwellia sp.]|nr:DUF349 domain-containing protein [Colwellia sp.]